MPYPTNQFEDTGSFIQTTQLLDVAEVYETDVKSDEFKELIVRLYQNLNNMALAVNNKISGQYVTTEYVTSKQYFNPGSTDPQKTRTAYRKVIDCGALPAGVKNIPHGIPAIADYKFTLINGCATDSVGINYYPLPFAGAAGNNIELRADATNIIINNTSGVAFTSCLVDVEYLKFQDKTWRIG